MNIIIKVIYIKWFMFAFAGGVNKTSGWVEPKKVARVFML